jgi:mono/diheme cytochrome c family protein
MHNHLKLSSVLSKHLLLTVALVATAAGCTDELTVSSAACASGLKWNGGNEEHPEMNPGENCITCHTRDDGPAFSVAGTVYAKSAEPNDCYGVPSATIEIVGADNVVHTVKANSAGNFYLNKGSPVIKLPYKAAVIVDGKRREMVAAQMDGSCNSCHTAQGAGGAPGRVLVPE